MGPGPRAYALGRDDTLLLPSRLHPALEIDQRQRALVFGRLLEGAVIESVDPVLIGGGAFLGAILGEREPHQPARRLARLYLDGVGAPHDPRQAARWFGLSAQKGQCQSQAMLGAMLFAGDHVPRQAARGLMWLTLAKDSAKEGAATDQAWINRLYDSAFQQATEDERALALVYLKRWMETRRE